MTAPFPRRIGIFLPTLMMGGAEKVMLELAHGWRQRGIEVDFILAEAVGPLLDRLPPGTHVEVVGQRGYARSIRPLARYLDARRPDVLLGSLYINDVVAVLAAGLARHRPLVVLGAHASLTAMIRHPTGNKDRWLLAPLVRATFRFADAIVAVSDGVARDVERVAWLPRGRVASIPNPVIDANSPGLAAAALDHRWFGDGGPPVLLSLGRLVPEKGLDVLLDALARLTVAARLIVVGGGPERDALERQAHALGIADRVDFAGPQANPFAWMARADLFVMASRYEGMGNTLVEALSCGTPVVSSDCDYGPAEILERGDYGWLTPVGDPVALAEGIAQALDAPRDDPRKARARLKARAADFTVDRALDAYLDLFASLQR